MHFSVVTYDLVIISVFVFWGFLRGSEVSLPTSFLSVFLFLLLSITVSIDIFSIIISKLRTISEMKQSLEQVDTLFIDRDLLTAQQYCIVTGHQCDFSIYCMVTV